jgi:hypothetical protein
MVQEKAGPLSGGPAEGPEPEGEDFKEAGRFRKEDVIPPVYGIEPEPAVRVQHLQQADPVGWGAGVKGAGAPCMGQDQGIEADRGQRDAGRGHAFPVFIRRVVRIHTLILSFL